MSSMNIFAEVYYYLNFQKQLSVGVYHGENITRDVIVKSCNFKVNLTLHTYDRHTHTAVYNITAAQCYDGDTARIIYLFCK